MRIGLKTWSEYRYELAVLLIVIISGFLRFYNLLFQSYWLDELSSVYTSNPSRTIVEVYNMSLEGAPPLYHLFLWCWYQLFEFNEYSGRAFSAFLGVFIVLLGIILARVLFNQKTAIYAGVLIAFNPFLIMYSQEVRTYSLFTFLSLLSLFLFLKAINTSKEKYYLLYVMSILLVIYSHYFGFFLLIAQFLFICLVKINWLKKNSIWVLICAFLIFIGVFPLINNILILSKIDDFWISKPSIFFPFYYLKSYFKSNFILLLLTLLFIINIFFNKEKFIRKRDELLFLIYPVLVCFGLAFIRSVLSTPLLTERNTIFVVPLLLVTIAYVFTLIESTKIRAFTLILFLFLNGFVLKEYYGTVKKQQWRNVVHQFKSEKKVRDKAFDIVFNGEFYKEYSNLLGCSNLGVKNKKEFIRYVESNKGVKDPIWILDAHDNNLDILKLKLNFDYDILSVSKFKNARLIKISLK